METEKETEQDTTEEVTGPSVRELLEKGFEGSDVEQESARTGESDTDTSEADKGGSDRDEKGRFKGKEQEKPAAEEPAAEEQPEEQAEEQTEEAAEEPEQRPQDQGLRAPQSLNAVEKEAWGKLSGAEAEVLKRAVLRREREITTALNDTAVDREVGQTFRQIVGPFEAHIRAEGSDPYRAVDNLLRQAIHLRMAPAPQKAEMLAGLCHNFLGSTEDAVEMFEQAWLRLIKGGVPGAAQQQAQQFRDPRFDSFIQTIQTQKQNRDRAQVEQYKRELSDFATKNDLFDLVKEEMYYLIEKEGRKGVDLSWKDAYDRACRLNEEASKILAQRKAKAKTTEGSATSRSKAASKTVRANPGGSRISDAAGPKDDTVKAELERNWDRMQRQ